MNVSSHLHIVCAIYNGRQASHYNGRQVVTGTSKPENTFHTERVLDIVEHNLAHSGAPHRDRTIMTNISNVNCGSLNRSCMRIKKLYF